MKKLMTLAVMAIAAASFFSCGNPTPKANLKTDVDTMSYAIGLAQSQGLKEYLVGRLGIDTAYMDDFFRGLNDGANAGDNKKKAAYYAGIQIGQQVSQQMIKGINAEVFGQDSTKTVSVKNFLAGFVTGTKGEKGIFTPEQAQEVAQTKIVTIRAKEVEKAFGANKAAGEKFLAENAKKEGVKTLNNGVQYKVIKAGTGAIPTDSSMVTVNYEGKTIDGKVFDSTMKEGGKPAKMKANQVIKGWTEVLTHMPVGSKWEVYIPQDQAYGDRSQRDIDPFSALIFTIELLSIDK